MNILIIGGSGLFGRKLFDLFNTKTEYNVHATYQHTPIEKDCFHHLDITNENEINQVFKKVKPDITILCSAFTDVDGCEQYKEKSYQINAIGAKKVACMVEHTNGKILYVSTDYVFDGNKGNYKENDMTNPINYYGHTKLKGEVNVKNFCSNYVIARTSVIYGDHKPNFVTWLISQLSQNKQVSIVTDQIISPTHTLDLSEQIYSLIKHDVKGIYHTTGGEQLSRFNFTKEIAKVFNLDEELITPISMSNINWFAKRPKNSSLDVSKITKFKKPYTVKHSLQVLKDTFSGVED